MEMIADGRKVRQLQVYLFKHVTSNSPQPHGYYGPLL